MNYKQSISADTTVAVVGLGLLGRGIAACFLGHGFRVIGFGRSGQSHEQARKYIARGLQDLVEYAGFEANGLEFFDRTTLVKPE